MSNIFKQFREYQSRKVDNPEYKPLGQPILEKTPTREEIRKEYKRKRHADYYKKHREELLSKMRERYYEYKKTEAYKGVLERRKQRRRVDPNKLTALQQVVYNYIVEKYKENGDIPRATQIARDLQKTDASIYSVIDSLVKKGKLFKGAMGKLFISDVLDGKEPEPEMVYVDEDKYDEVLKENESLKNKVKELEDVALKRYRKHIDGEDYSPGYVGQLKASIKTGQKIISELKERVVYLEEKLEKVQVVEVNEENKSDYLKKLEDQNNKLADEVIILRKIVKYLSRYID